MKFDYLSKRLGGYALAFFVLFGMATVGVSSAQAQWRRDDGVMTGVTTDVTTATIGAVIATTTMVIR